MAFPTITGGPTATQNASGSSISVTMPGGIVAGELLLLFCAVTGASHSVSGWTSIASSLSGSGGSVVACWAKVAAGSDTATISPSGSQQGGAIVHRIGGWSGVLADVTGTATNQGVTTAAPNPPNHTAPYLRDNLWFAVGGGNGTPSMTAPANYGSLSTALLGGSSAILAQASRALNAASENPGAFTGSVGNPTVMTIAVPPPVAAPLLFQQRRRRFRPLLNR